MKNIRSPIIGVLGHVDHGKTSLLDAIRGSKVAQKEAGGITQMVGASYITKEHILNLSKGLQNIFKFNIIIPGLLFIDTPGHEAFSNLRERGGSIADMAILVVDAFESFQPQTIESINILKQYKTPFLIAMNKIDLIKGWKNNRTYSILESLNKQSQEVKEYLDNLLYKLIGDLSEYGFNGERFDRIDDFTKTIAIIPTSAKTNEGLAELLLLIAGISQRYLKNRLFISPNEPAKGSVIEIKEEKGMGTTLDVIIHDGVLKKKDVIVLATKQGIKEAKVRGLFQPNVSSNNPNEKYKPINSVVAAAGVKILTSNIKDVVPGSPFGVKGGIDIKELEHYIKSIMFNSKEEGIIAKVDSLGSAEALLNICKKASIKIKKIGIGAPTKEDILEAKVLKEKNFEYGAILVFNLSLPKEILSMAQSEGVSIISNYVIYKLIEDYEEWKETKRRELYRKMISELPSPAKIRILPNFIFRKSKPAIVGIEVLEGKLTPNNLLINKNGEIVGELKSIQEKNQSLKEAIKGQKVAVSINNAEVGKNINEGDILYVNLYKNQIELWIKNKSLLSEDDLKIIKEVEAIIKKAKINKKLSN